MSAYCLAEGVFRKTLEEKGMLSHLTKGAVVALSGGKDSVLLLSLFAAYAKGYCGAVKASITEKEKELLPYGAYLMTIECGMRFLTDYLSGDTYFATKYEGHNLVRCRTQIRLAAEMEANFEEMGKIVVEACK